MWAQNLFLDIQEFEDGHVSFGNSKKVRVKGWGNICVSQKNGKEGTMEEVYYVPDLKSNILSMGQLLEKGCSVFMKYQILHPKEKNGRVLANVEMVKNRMFKPKIKEYIVKKILL